MIFHNGEGTVVPLQNIRKAKAVKERPLFLHFSYGGRLFDLLWRLLKSQLQVSAGTQTALDVDSWNWTKIHRMNLLVMVFDCSLKQRNSTLEMALVL